MTGALARVQTESHRLIEHLMIAANEQVVGLLVDRGVPALYRVHERPDPEAVTRLLAQLASLSVPTPPAPELLRPGVRAGRGDRRGRLAARVRRRRAGTGREGHDALGLRSPALV